MGLIQNGILGGFSGKVGTVVGGNWRGKEVMRSKPRKRKKAKRTDAQKDHQAKFTLAAQFAQSMKDLLDVGFQHYAKGKTGVNSAVAIILKNAITGTYPDYRIAYEKVQVSRGSLLNPLDGKAAAGPKDTIQFTWTYTADHQSISPDDLVVMVAYLPEANMTVYKFGAPRSAGTDSLVIPGAGGKTVHTWISFISADQADIATSIYSGEVTIV